MFPHNKRCEEFRTCNFAFITVFSTNLQKSTIKTKCYYSMNYLIILLVSNQEQNVSSKNNDFVNMNASPKTNLE